METHPEKPPVIGFSVLDSPSFESATVNETVKITMPASLKLQWKKRGDYIVTDEAQGEQRIVTAVIKNQPRHQVENHMVSSVDIEPIFLASSLENWQEIGAIYWRLSHDKVLVTPEVKALANQITGNKEGIEAARAIYNWIAKNIQYLAVSLDEAADVVPHTSIEVLHNGYGDCKDHVVLMQALLRAKGIDSDPVLVNWGDMFQQLPFPAPDQFNHAMIYLPAYNLFANPTDQNASFGELDTALTGKFVVIATEEGQTAYTPQSIADKNGYFLTSVVTISPDGTIEGQNKLKFFGKINSSVRSLFSSDTPEKIANQLLSQTPEGGTGTIEISALDHSNRPIAVESKWSSPYAINMDKQIYFTTPVGIDPENPYLFRDYIDSAQRLYPLLVEASNFNWEYKIKIPSGYKVSHIPKNINFSTLAGRYTSAYEIGNGSILVRHYLLIKNTVYSAEEYPTFKALIYKSINDARSVIVLEKL